MTTLETLKAARKLIEVPERWTKEEYARTAEGYALGFAGDSRAVCWCGQGAIRRVTGDESDMQPAIEALRVSVPDKCWSFTRWNDSHTHAEVLAAFDAAIAKAEAAHV